MDIHVKAGDGRAVQSAIDKAAVVIRGHHHDLVFRQNTIGHEKPADEWHAGILVSRHATGFQSADNQFRHV